ncbi:hypothetical protein EJB05_35504 [Eragrostis curvula]|uniref:Uncharacterized protein n=1 Tax=Eragrostis curvula TaxID=38414 RepID=A0A5J9U875_9POAL|nr:hypothetical protein EJB05_35504 [Eragrostis curvula]
MATTTPAVDRNGDGEQKKRKQGGYRTMPFILVNEICDRFATAGFSANLITYLTEQLHLPLVEATNTLTNFGGTSSLTPILGALAADSFAGRFWTIIGGSVFYQIGMIGLVVSALLPSLRPPPCSPPTTPCRRATGWQLAALYLSLLCTSLGSGGIRPCVVAFGADQFEQQQQQQEHEGGGEEIIAEAERKRRYFNLYFFTMGFAVLLALTVVVYIQDNVGWGWGFGIPAMGMFISIVVFLVGYPLYVKLKPGGSPFTRLVQVAAAAFKKRKAPLPEDPGMLYHDKELDALISTNGRLLHTNQLTFFDRAAILTPGDITSSGQPDLWRLSTVHRVEELKSIVRLLPIWSAGIMLATAGSHNYTLTILQARTMDRRVAGHFDIPPATLSIFSTAAMLISLGLYDRVFVPLARRVTGLRSGITYFQRMGIGLAISVVSVATAAIVETKRRNTAAEHGLADNPAAVVPLSVFWLVPQFAIHGIADAFANVAGMEFLYDQAPESMRSSAVALFWLAGSLGNYMGTVLVTVVQRTTKGRGEWLQDNINRGRIDNYYWLVTCIMVINFGYYLLCFHFYTMKPLEVADGHEDPDKECELASVHQNGTHSNPEGIKRASSLWQAMATTMPTVDRNGDGKQKRRKQGGFRTMPFILASEMCDRFAMAGFSANMITYLTQQLHLPLVEASNTLTNFSGTSSLTPILGALAADAYAGRFWTIIAGSVFYQIGMVGLVVSALVRPLRPPPCTPPATTPCRRATGWQLAVLYLSLLCTSLGSGGIRPCVVAFGADQLEQQQQQQKQSDAEAVAGRKRRYFNLYFFTMGLAALLALTVVVYIQDNVGWGWGFGIPAMGMFVSIVVFVVGYPLYVRPKPGGSPFTRLAQVVAAAVRKRDAAVPDDPTMLYEDKELDALISTTGRLLHTNQLTDLQVDIALKYAAAGACKATGTLAFPPVNAKGGGIASSRYPSGRAHLGRREGAPPTTDTRGAGRALRPQGRRRGRGRPRRAPQRGGGVGALRRVREHLARVVEPAPPLIPPPRTPDAGSAPGACRIAAASAGAEYGVEGAGCCWCCGSGDDSRSTTAGSTNRKWDDGSRSTLSDADRRSAAAGHAYCCCARCPPPPPSSAPCSWGSASSPMSRGLAYAGGGHEAARRVVEPTPAAMATISSAEGGRRRGSRAWSRPQPPRCHGGGGHNLRNLGDELVVHAGGRRIVLNLHHAGTDNLFTVPICQLRFFDRAAIVTPGDITTSGKPDLWRLSTVHRVEELKSIIRLLPIWSAGIMLAAAGSHNHTFIIMQARTMDRHVAGHFDIPPATLSIFSTATMLVALALYDRAFVPLARRVTGLRSGITYFQRMGVGLAVSILSVGTAALVETKRRGAAAEHGLLDKPAAVVPLSVFWLVPQFAVHGIAEAFSSVAHMEFLYDQAPESMRSSAAALFWLSSSLGSYMGTVLVTAVQRATKGRGEWLQDNINRGRLDNYYWLVTCIMVLNLGYYLLCFHFYTMKPLEVAEEHGDHDKECELSSVHKNGDGSIVGTV